MSHLFRALKKVPKSPSNSQPPISHFESDETTAKKSKDPEASQTVENLPFSDLIDENSPAVEITKETKEDLVIDSSVDDLKLFCDKLDDFIEKSQNILDKAYANDAQRVLQRRLKNSVTELLNIQNQVKTIVDNIKSVKMQITAVRNNIEDHKNKLNTLKAEERRTRFLLAHETNKREKNARNQEKCISRNRESSLPKYYITSNSGGTSRPAAGRTTFISIPAGAENESNSNNSNFIAPNRPPRNSNRTLATTVKRVKAIRAKKDSMIPLPQSDPNGVTIFLRPINESDRRDNLHSAPSHHSTPSTSIVNFPWFNNNPPDQTHSDTATNSVVSASNSLFVFSSSGRFDDLD